MTKRNNKQSPNKNKNANKPTSGGRVGAGRRRRPGNTGVLGDVRAAEWEMLLRDPCNAKIVPPCYTGADGGYTIRTVNIFQPEYATSGLAPGDVVPVDSVVQVCPYNWSETSGIRAGTVRSSTPSVELQEIGIQDFITTSSAVKRYRPVAACVKWVPNGAYGTRSGTVGLAYTPGQTVVEGETVVLKSALPLCQHISANGSETHEVRWLPTIADERWTSAFEQNSSGAGNMFVTLQGVDGIATSANRVVINGYFEITTVFQWTPDYSLSAIKTNVFAPSPYSSQQILSTIKDMGMFLFHGVRTLGPMVREGMGMARGYNRLLTNGYGEFQYRGNAM